MIRVFSGGTLNTGYTHYRLKGNDRRGESEKEIGGSRDASVGATGEGWQKAV